jgi:two-component system KDP operon response regulator KdpE
MDPKVLVIDDDLGLLTMLRLGLELQGFDVTTACGGKEGLRRAYQTHPDVVVLDIAMSEMDGWTTCERLRQVSDVPVIMLSGKTAKADIVKSLSMGADDYLTKPCSLNELSARINSRLRRSVRSATAEKKAIYDDGHLHIDLHKELVLKDGELVELSPTEYRLLAHLVQERGHIVSHRDLLTSVWGPEYPDELRYLSVYIRYLRRKIEHDPSNPRYIQTRWKLGYLFCTDEMIA